MGRQSEMGTLETQSPYNHDGAQEKTMADVEDFDAYAEAHNRKRQKFQRGAALVSAVLFFGSLAVTGFRSFSSVIGQPNAQEAQQAAVNAKQARLKQEEAGYHSVLQREPNNAVALNGLAEVSIQLKNWKAAEDAFARILKQDPKDMRALDGLAATRIAQKHWKGAIEPLEKLASLSSDPSYKALLKEVKQKASTQ